MEGQAMKSGIDETSEWRLADRWARVLEGRDDAGRVGAVALASPQPNKKSRPTAQRHAVIRVTRRYGVPPARVFDAWLDPEVAGRWLFATASRPLAHIAIDARVEGAFCFVERQDGDIATYTGEYIEIVPHRRLVFTLSTEKYPHVDTRVRVEIAPLAKGCALTLTHENVPRNHAERMEGRWTGILYGLGVTLDVPSAESHHHQE
jgi:uncharacterized protein YndB with AHSA1/START domain